MANQSLSYQIKQLELEVSLILRKVDIRAQSQKDRDLLAEIQDRLADARRYVLDYEGSEDSDAQARGAKFSRKWLRVARKNILELSDIFSAVETAQLSAKIDQIIGVIS